MFELKLQNVSFLRKFFIIKGLEVATLAEIIKSIIMLVKTTFKDAVKVKRIRKNNQNSFFLYFWK